MNNKVTKEGVEAVIAREEYAQWPNSTLTICTLTLRNGFHVTGESACVDPANFDEQLGRDLARKEAFDKACGFEAYLLAEVRYQTRQAEIASLEAALVWAEKFLADPTFMAGRGY